MPRATIPDIARAAQVSAATVDRVLNERGGVKPALRQRVLSAAQALGYLPSKEQTVLPARPVRLEFFLPRRLQTFLAEVADLIETFCTTLPLVSSVQVHDLPDLRPETLVEALGALSLDTRGVGLVTVDHPLTRQAIRDLVGSDVAVVTIASDLTSTQRTAHVGVDDRIAGRTAAHIMGRFCMAKSGAIALFVGQRTFQGQRERELGFRAVMERDFPRLSVLPSIDTKSSNVVSYDEARRLFEVHPGIEGIYAMGGGRRGLIEALRQVPPERRPIAILHDLSSDTRRALAEGVIDLIIDQNARLVAEQAVIRLLGAIATGSQFLPVHYIEPRLIFRENLPQ